MFVLQDQQDFENEKTEAIRKLIAPQNPEENKVRTKVASAFNTNRTYVNEATRLKAEKPELFEQVKSGEKTITQAVRDPPCINGLISTIKAKLRSRKSVLQ